MSKICIVPYEEKYLLNYQLFAIKNWGKGTYKASQKYINWLYQDNPSLNKSPDDFTVAITEDNQVVGTLHKMRFPWNINGITTEVPAIHNLLVEEQFQAGYGLFLVANSLKGTEHVFVPAVVDPISSIYDKLHCQKVDVSWYFQLFNIFNLGFIYLGRKLLKYTQQPKYFDEKWNFESRTASAIVNPDAVLCKTIADKFNEQLINYAAKPQWDAPWVKWRFFQENGPRHLFVQSKNSDDFLILSLGPRKGLNIARIIDGFVSSADSLQILVAFVKKILVQNQVYVLLTYCAQPRLNQFFQDIGWKTQGVYPKTYFYHKNKNDFKNYSFSASVGDFGFEGIPL